MKRLLPSVISLTVLLGILGYKFIKPYPKTSPTVETMTEASSSSETTTSAQTKTASASGVLGTETSQKEPFPPQIITPEQAATISFDDLETELDSLLIEDEDFSNL